MVLIVFVFGLVFSLLGISFERKLCHDPKINEFLIQLPDYARNEVVFKVRALLTTLSFTSVLSLMAMM